MPISSATSNASAAVFVKDLAKPSVQDQLDWLRHELGDTAELDEFARKYIELFRCVVHGEAVQRRKCLELFAQYDQSVRRLEASQSEDHDDGICGAAFRTHTVSARLESRSTAAMQSMCLPRANIVHSANVCGLLWARSSDADRNRAGRLHVVLWLRCGRLRQQQRTRVEESSTKLAWT